jgi:hypothetical protein
MTDHRHLKQLVRARMARTGESYSAARRQVVAKVRVPGLVHGYDTFGTRRHHESSLVRNLLRQVGVDCGEAMVCGLGGGVGFMYAMFEYTGIPPMATIVMQHHPQPWLPAVLGRLRIGYAERHSTSPGSALAALRAELAAGRAVHCLVDRSALPWHQGEPTISADPYGVVVAGEHDGAFLVDDRDPAPHIVAEGAFVAAWSRYRKGRHHRVTIDPGEPTDLGVAAREAVATTVAHLTGPVLGNAFDVNFGFSGMRRLAAQLRDRGTRNGWTKRLTDPGALVRALRRLHDGVEVEYTAAGGTRPLYADFLDEIGAPEAAAAFRESAAHWSELADRALASAQGDLADLAARRMSIVLTRGRAGADEIRALTREIAAHPVPEVDLDGLADLVDAARGCEERAVAALS